MVIFLNIIYILIISICCVTRYKNTCNCNDDKNKYTDIIQILILGIGLYYITGLNIIFKLIGLLFLSIPIRIFLQYIFNKFIYKEKETEENEKCKDCNSYEKWEK